MASLPPNRAPLARARTGTGEFGGTAAVYPRVRRPGVESRTAWRRTAVRGPSVTGPRHLLQRRGATSDLLASARILQREASGSFDADTSESEIEGESSAQSGQPVDVSFFQLKVVKILPPANPAPAPEAIHGRASTASAFSFESFEDEEETTNGRHQEERNSTLNSLVDDCFTVGPHGVTIGTSKECDVRLPRSSKAEPVHAKITWSRTNTSIVAGDGDGNGESIPGIKLENETGKKMQLTFRDLTGNGQFQFTSERGVAVELPDTENIVSQDLFSTPITSSNYGGEQNGLSHVMNHGDIHWRMKISVGRVQLSVLPLTPEKLVSACLFAAIRSNDLNTVMTVTEAAKESGGLKGTGSSCPLLRQTSVQSAKRLNLEIDETQQGAGIFEEDEDEEQSSDLEQALTPFHALPGRSTTRRTHRSGHYSIRGETARRYMRMYRQVLDSSVGLLQVAVELGNPAIVTFLLEEGADVNRVFECLNATPLQIAVARGDIAVAKTLLRYGASVEMVDSSGRMPFQRASSHAMRQLLLNTTLLCSAAEAGDVTDVQRLLDAGVPVNGVGLGSKTALHFACIGGQGEIVKMLIRAGANVNLKGGSRLRTPLHYAALAGCVEIVQCLIDAGAREHTQDSLGYVALNLTDKAEICRLLSLNTQAPSLCLAAQGGDVDEARRLLENKDLGAEERLDLVNQRNEQHHAAIHLACVAGNLELVQLLIRYSADVDLPGGGDEWTPLMFAGMAGQASVVEYLLSIGADQSLCNSAGHTVQDLVGEGLQKVKAEQEAGKECCMYF